MKVTGRLLKMRSILEEIVQYEMPVGEELINMNGLIGKKIQMHYLNKINCIKCGRETNKSFAQGFCYPCFISAPETEECVLRPELCRAHEGIARDMDYARAHCLNDQYVYLSVTSGIKVGVTRKSQVPTRWIDQGAVQAVKLAKTPNRYLAGLMEVFLKNHLADKTNWRNMLMNIIGDVDLIKERDRVGAMVDGDLAEFILADEIVQEIVYPVEKYPTKITSISFDKTPEFFGTLSGIKGQYLLFDDNRVINIRKFSGYNVEMKIV